MTKAWLHPDYVRDPRVYNGNIEYLNRLWRFHKITSYLLLHDFHTGAGLVVLARNPLSPADVPAINLWPYMTQSRCQVMWIGVKLPSIHDRVLVSVCYIPPQTHRYRFTPFDQN